MKLVFVEWVDSHYMSGWHLLEDIPKMYSKHIVSCGYLFREDKQNICIAQNVGLDDKGNIDQVSEMMTIPRCAIKKIRTLKKTSK